MDVIKGFKVLPKKVIAFIYVITVKNISPVEYSEVISEPVHILTGHVPL